MSAKVLLIIGLVWFGAVIIWSRFRLSFVFGIGHGQGAKAVAFLLLYLIEIFTFGWIVPLALGAYRLLKKH
jgi:hypothetical protein